MRNDEIASRLEEMADLLEAQDVEYKPRAYRRAAETVRETQTPIAELAAEGQDAVEELDHVGEAIASKAIEYVETGGIEELEELRAELPVEMDALTRVEGVGPKTVGSLYEALGIETLDDLEDAAQAGEIQEIRGFGAKTEENILENVPFAREAHERQLLGDARPLADDLLGILRDHDAVERCETAGSIRRWKPTIGDVDLLAATDDPEAVIDRFADWERATTVIEAGSKKASVTVDDVRVDLRVVSPDQFGSALQYFTGSWDHNVTLRNHALERDVSLNEYGAFDVAAADESDPEDPQAKGDRVGGDTEESMYAAVGLPWIPPELREDRGEVAAAAEGDLPDLLEPGAIRGDCHVHTEWSDGDPTIAELAAAAAAFGHDYLCITDHATGPGMVGGVGVPDEELREQLAEIRDADETAEIDLYAGVEANIDAEGGLSVADDVLADLDWVVASPHSALDQDRDAATDRLIAAVEHPAVDAIGHPTGRLLNRREGLAIDPERLASAAAEHDVALEVNANPQRLDLDGAAVKAAVDAGAPIVINTDAHRPAEFEHVRYGVHTARRGWAEPDDVVNARDPEGFRSFLE